MPIILMEVYLPRESLAGISVTLSPPAVASHTCPVEAVAVAESTRTARELSGNPCPDSLQAAEGRNTFSLNKLL